MQYNHTSTQSKSQCIIFAKHTYNAHSTLITSG